MARRITSNSNMITPAGVADTTAFTSGQALALYQGGSATQYTRFWEISVTGMAASTSSPTPLIFARDSTAGVGAYSWSATTYNDSNMDPFSAALAAPVKVGNVAATTYPQRDVANHLQACGLNAFGGVYFWRANRAEECPAMYGTAVDVGDISFSSTTGGTNGAVNFHIIYEPS